MEVVNNMRKREKQIRVKGGITVNRVARVASLRR